MARARRPRDPVEVVTTFPSRPKRAVDAFVGRAVRARLAACGNVTAAVSSTYWWKGKVERAAEVWISFKTAPGRARELRAWIEREHPYDVPLVAVVPLQSTSRAYAGWVSAETQPRAPTARSRRPR